MQILITGAGPVGLTMAIELARYGVPVRIIDKAAQRSDKSKALVLWSRTLELLERSGSSAGLVAAGHKVHAANIVAGDEQIARLNFDGVDSPYSYALMLPQADTERLLEERLAALGVLVERQTELLAFTDTGTETGDGINVTLRLPDGSESKSSVDWLIGCDGAHSTVRHLLGLSFHGATLQSDWVLADVHIAGMPTPDSELALYWHAAGMLAIFPITPGRFRIIADLGPSAGEHPADPTLEQFQSIVDQRGPGGLVLSDPVWLSAFRINERKVVNYRAGRVFIAGDAAHVHSPAGGQGMNTGMQDACNLAWKLALVCRGICPDGTLLDSYSIERSAVGEQVLADAGRLTALAVVRNHALQTLRNLAGHFLLGLTLVNRLIRDKMTEVSIGYPHSPLNGAHANSLNGPAPGERVVPGVVPMLGQSPVGTDVSSGINSISSSDMPRFALFAAQSEAALALLQRYPTLLETELHPPFEDYGMWLVRPDGYVACTVASTDIHLIADYLDMLERP